MGSFHEDMHEYKNQLGIGSIKIAYQGLMKYFGELRAYFNKKYPDLFASSNIYYGFMDMTYFALFPKQLKNHKLKIAIVFIHDTLRFEAWLAGVNKQVQAKYWKLIQESNWNKYHLVSTLKDTDSIIEYVLADNPDFNDLGALTRQIENGTLIFIKDVEHFLSEH